MQKYNSYQKHDVTDGPLNVKSFNSLDADQITRRAELREEDEGAIHFHDLSDLVQACEKDAVNLWWRHNTVLHEQSCRRRQLVNLCLSHGDVLRSFASDEDLLWVSSLCSWVAVSIDLREWWWEVDGGIGSRLNELDVLSGASADDGV